jgi:hypothetical protein
LPALGVMRGGLRETQVGAARHLGGQSRVPGSDGDGIGGETLAAPPARRSYRVRKPLSFGDVLDRLASPCAMIKLFNAIS